jgi:hypothetical protein
MKSFIDNRSSTTELLKQKNLWTERQISWNYNIRGEKSKIKDWKVENAYRIHKRASKGKCTNNWSVW